MSRNGVNTPRNCRGISLVELMVSMVLGLLLTLGTVRIYLDSKLNYAADEEFARLQENGRFALNTIKRELTLAGFYGGDMAIDDIAVVPVANDCGTGEWALDPGDPIDIVNNFAGSAVTSTGIALTCLTDEDGTAPIQPGSDIISVKRTAGDPTVKNGALQRGVAAAQQEQWYLERRNYGETRAWVYIDSGEDFPAADIGTDTRVDFWEYYSRVLYLRNYSRTAGDGVPTLCTSELVGDAMTNSCLVPGVEDMQIEFGIDTNGDGVPNRFKDTPTAAELSGAVAVRVYLLMRSANPIAGYTNSKAYTLGRKTIAARNDAFYRRVMVATVQTRNANLPVAI